jgi:uncharacterized membrane protein YgcG
VGAFVMAWLVGEGIISYRTVKEQHAPPGPGQLLWSSGVFVLLALLAESPKARPLAVTLAWGFDIAAMLNLFSVGTAKMGVSHWPPDTLPPNVIFPSGLKGAIHFNNPGPQGSSGLGSGGSTGGGAGGGGGGSFA